MSASSLIWGSIFGTIGLAFFMYGRKRPAVVPLICGLALMIFPYFTPDGVATILVGVVLMLIPYFVRI